MAQTKQSLKLTESQTMRMLELYQDEPSLFDLNSDSYSNRDMRASAAKRISNALNISGFGPKEVVKKFKNLRNAYSQELRKIKYSEVSGAGADDLYTPTVYWFEIMDNFLRPYIYARPTKSNLVVEDKQKGKKKDDEYDGASDGNDETQMIEDTNKLIVCPSIIDNATRLGDTLKNAVSNTKVLQKNNDIITGKRKAQHIDSPSAEHLNISMKRRNPIPPQTVKKRVSADFNLNQAVSKLHQIPQSAAALRQDDIYDTFGRYIASLLRSLNNQTKAINLQQQITNVIFNSMHDSSGST